MRIGKSDMSLTDRSGKEDAQMLWKRQKRAEEPDALLEQFLDYRKRLISKDAFEARWKELKERYSRISLYRCEFVGIGETVPRLFNMLEDLEQEDGDTLYVVLPYFSRNYHGDLCNKRILDIFGSRLHFVNDSNIDFWIYVIARHRDEIDIAEIDRYRGRKLGLVHVQVGECKIGFSADQIKEAERKMSQMGIDRRFVCILARETNHKKLGWGDDIAKEFSIYTCALDAFRSSVEYLQDQGMQVVRMGKYENEVCDLPGVIDYAGRYHDELMDLYLLSKGKFIVDSGGLGSIAGFWGIPFLNINLYDFHYGAESAPVTGKDMMLIQKVWSERKQRYLTLRESLDVYYVCELHLSNYEKRGIRLIKNTEEEIYHAVVEMDQRLNGRWVESAEERAAVEKFQEIMDRWKEEHDFVWMRRRAGWKGYQMCPYRICWSYLKENMYLLDDRSQGSEGVV